MIGFFKSPGILKTDLKFKVIDEKGQDEDGVSREVYTIFWQQFIESCSEGEHARVAAIFPDLGLEEWQAVGRILAKDFIDCNVFPLRLAQAFVIALFFDQSDVNSETLLDSFLLFLNATDRDVISRALSGKMNEEDNGDLIDILDHKSGHSLPTPETMKSTILQTAHKCL